MLNQLPVMPRFRIVGADREFTTLQEAALAAGKLTLNKGYALYYSNAPAGVLALYKNKSVLMKRDGSFKRDTLFKEIEAVMSPLTSEIKRILNKPVGRAKINAPVLGGMLAEAMMNYIEKSWDSSKTHVVSHSSGYDSRLISFILKKLAEKNGYDWLGELYFICFQPEIEQFRKIMDYEGWEDKYIITIKEHDSPTDYFASALEFEELGKYCSDVNRIGVYCFGYILDKEIEKLGKDVQMVSGLWSDEVLKRSIWPDLSYLLVRCLHDIHFEWGKYDVILPFVSSNFLDIHTDYFLDIKPDDVKREISNHLDSGLFGKENYRFTQYKIIKEQGTLPVFRLSDEVRNNMDRAYYNSFYFKAIGEKIIAPNSIRNIHKEFKSYMKAAICEYLIQEGVTINA